MMYLKYFKNGSDICLLAYLLHSLLVEFQLHEQMTAAAYIQKIKIEIDFGETTKHILICCRNHQNLLFCYHTSRLLHSDITY